MTDAEDAAEKWWKEKMAEDVPNNDDLDDLAVAYLDGVERGKDAARARIAELEELLTEPLYASEHYVLNKTYKKYANDKVGRITVSFGWMRRLHAALNGEK